MTDTMTARVGRIIKRDDIRGKYPDDVDEVVAYWLGRAIVSVIFPATKPVIAVGFDARLSSPALSQVLMRGLAQAGADVRDIGVCSTEVVYYAAGSGAVDGGVMVTASHNPKDENGFKIVKHGAEPIDSGELKQLGDELQRLFQATHQSADLLRRAQDDRQTGELPVIFPHIDLVQAYVDKVLAVSGVRRTSASRLKVVVEAGNGMGGVIFRAVAARLPFLDVVYSNATPDGHFPVQLPNPLKPEYMQLVRDRVLREGAGLGLAFDGDADRVGVVDSHGHVLTASEIMALVIARFLAPGQADRKIMYNLVCSRLVSDAIYTSDGIGWMTPVGHGQIKQRMRNPRHRDCVFAGEHSGHFFFRDFFQADSGMIAALMMIDAALAAREAGSELHAQLLQARTRYFACSETNFNIRQPDPSISAGEERRLMQASLERVRSAYAATGTEIKDYAPGDPIQPSGGVDILKMELADSFGSWWFCVRPSGNEPLLRLMVEIVLNPDVVGQVDGQQVLDGKFNDLVNLIGRQYLALKA